MNVPRIDHSVPPVPLAAGSYYVTTAGGYHFIYPVVALARVEWGDGRAEWEAVYLHDTDGLEPALGDKGLVYMTPEEAASLRRTFNELNDLRSAAVDEVETLLNAAGEDGVDYMTVHRIIWDARIKEAPEEEKFLGENVCASVEGGRVYAYGCAPSDDAEGDR